MLKKSPLVSRPYFKALGIPSIFFCGLVLASILGWDWKAGLAKMAARGGFYQMEEIFPVKAKVVEVYDGDTFLINNGMIVRMIGINAPDRGELGYQEAGDFLNGEINNKTVALEYDKYQDDKFGRILAYVWKDGELINVKMVKNGFAKVVIYEDRRKLKYEDLLTSASSSSYNSH